MKHSSFIYDIQVRQLLLNWEQNVNTLYTVMCFHLQTLLLLHITLLKNSESKVR